MNGCREWEVLTVEFHPAVENEAEAGEDAQQGQWQEGWIGGGCIVILLDLIKTTMATASRSNEDMFYAVVPDDELQEHELTRLMQNRVGFILVRGLQLSGQVER